MNKQYRVVVFGKKNCDKCKVLNQRLDSLLAKDEWKDFEKLYYDVLTEDGIVEFAKMECINPQRIPAMVVTKRTDETFQPLKNPEAGQADEVCRGSKLHTYLGLQTDYSESGLLTPAMVTSVLARAREL